MRTIKKSFVARLAIQADEARIQGLTKVAENLSEQLETNPVRENSESYFYPEQDFKKDLEVSLWDAAIRVADFYDLKQFDAKIVQEIIEKTASDMVYEICMEAGMKSDVGAYDKMPGEKEFEIVVEEEV